jgi:hypothetical protein
MVENSFYKANLDIQYTTGLSYPTPNIYYRQVMYDQIYNVPSLSRHLAPVARLLSNQTPKPLIIPTNLISIGLTSSSVNRASLRQSLLPMARMSRR